MAQNTTIPSTVPTTFSLDLFRQNILGNWIIFLEKDPAISDVTFQPDGKTLSVLPAKLPDREIDFALPSIIITRLAETIKPSRIGNYHTSIVRDVEGDQVETSVYAYRMNCMYQFDVITRDLASQFVITSFFDKKLLGKDVIDDYDEIRIGVKRTNTTSFALRDLSQRTSYTDDVLLLPETDVRVYWKPQRDIKSVETTAFNTEFEQMSYTIEFWCDLWYTEDDKIITNIIVEESRFSL